MKKAAIIRGDDTGPKLVDSMMRVMDAVSPEIEFVFCDAGEEWWKEHGGDSLIPDDTWDLLKRDRRTVSRVRRPPLALLAHQEALR